MNTIIEDQKKALPQLTPIDNGKQVKSFEVTGKGGMVMPDHHSTEEAIVIIQKGRARIEFEDNTQTLNVGDTILIPAGKPHKLSLLEDFKAIVVMPLASKIEFENH